MENIYSMEYDYIFVDEISMVKEIFYKFVITLKKIKPEMNFVIVGDFNQLPPINDRIDVFKYDFDYANSKALLELCDGNKLSLTKCRRADDKFFNICKFENINNINKDIFKSEFTDRHLAFTNEKRIEINETCMKLHKKKYHKTPIIIEKNHYDPNSQQITVFSSLPIISKKNDKKLDVVNNEQFVVKSLKPDGKILIKNQERELLVTKEDIKNMFYPAYCITIHQSQGASYNFPYTIHEWNRLNKKLKYTALTRSTCLEYVNII